LYLQEQVPIIVADALAARQWEIHLARDELRRSARAWFTPQVIAYRQWAERLWQGSASDGRLPLKSSQSSALWRRVIAESTEGDGLIDTLGPARWAGEAWHLLWNWRIDPAELKAASEQSDFRAFLGWCRTYAEQLRRASWIDQAQIDAALGECRIEPDDHIVLADLEDLSPARRALFSSCERRGTTLERWTAPRVARRAERVKLADSAAELLAAAGWARQCLDGAPDSRIALVISGLGQGAFEVERILSNTLDPRRGEAEPVPEPRFTLQQRGLQNDPLIGAALTGLELLSVQGTFASLSRWLRSPFYQGLEPAQASSAALLEIRLRGDVRAQLGFLEAYREAGLAGTLQRAVPRLADALQRALDALGAARQTCTASRWTVLWQDALRHLGWPGRDADHRTLRAWESALADFAQLTPILGNMSAARALRELRAVVSQTQLAAPWPTAGVYVFEHLDDVGPGYDCAWVTGFTDAHWPQYARSNPLLPRRLQVEHAMPWCSPHDALRRSERSLQSLARRVPELVISWPGREHDHEAQPSPLIQSFPEASADAILAAAGGPAQHGRPRPARTRAKQVIADPPPALEGARIPGGAGALNAQSRCPLRALCEYRLGARELEVVSPGLAPRLQGVATHRALELLLADLPSQAELRAVTAERVAECANRALSEQFGAAGSALQVVFTLEHERLCELVGAFLDKEARRSAFRVEAVERRRTLALGAWTIDVRIDRIDRLANGALAVIDYKTGRRAGAGDWFTERLRDTQIPLYAQQAGESVGAAVIVSLRTAGTRYSGLWSSADAFPDRSHRLPDDRSWLRQLDVWRVQIRQLADQLAAGDSRVRCEALAAVSGAYAPLSRVYEQLALHRLVARSGNADE
jgi:probable DNA repair protein